MIQGANGSQRAAQRFLRLQERHIGERGRKEKEGGGDSPNRTRFKKRFPERHD